MVFGCPCPSLLAASCGGWRRLGLSVCFLVLWGCVMAGFVSVVSSRGAGVVARPLSCGWVWARRALPGGVGWSPAPACLFVPFGSFALARVFARGVSALGWRVWLRSGSVGSPVFAACGLPVPAFAVKVALPSGVSVRAGYKVLFAASYPPRRHAWLVVRPRVGSVDNSHLFYI